jgi:dephospho-CoA kinase
MIVCVTGKSGSGKSEVMKVLKSLGFRAFIMDDYIHEIYEKDGIGYNLILEKFGKSFIDAKKVNRQKLGKYVFTNEKAMKLLDNIMIPVMQDKIAQIKSLPGVSFVELAVYMNHQTKFAKYFDKVILVKSAENFEKNNLSKKFSYVRKFPTNAVGKLKNPIKTAKINSNFTVDNSSNLKDLRKQVKLITEKL